MNTEQIHITKRYLSRQIYKALMGTISTTTLWEFCKLTKLEPTLYKIDSDCSLYIANILDEQPESESLKNLLTVLYRQLR